MLYFIKAAIKSVVWNTNAIHGFLRPKANMSLFCKQGLNLRLSVKSPLVTEIKRALPKNSQE